jgi:hypothetical protein
MLSTVVVGQREVGARSARGRREVGARSSRSVLGPPAHSAAQGQGTALFGCVLIRSVLRLRPGRSHGVSASRGARRTRSAGRSSPCS